MLPPLAAQAAQIAQLQLENATLREEVQILKSERHNQKSINLYMRRLGEKAFILPEDMLTKFSTLQYSVIELVAEMYKKLQEDPSHRANVIRAMNSAREAQAFRVALTQNMAVRGLATEPYSNESDVWTVCLWQFLIASVFSHEGTRSLYSSTGLNAADYIKKIDEIDQLMRPENELLELWEGVYARRLWRKQAIDAVFRTGANYGRDNVRFPREDHPWVASTRQESIDKLTSQILQIFDVFLGNLPGRADRVRELVAQAVHLNECFMHQADFAWTIELDTTGESSPAFYDTLDDMDMVAVNTDFRGRMNLNATKPWKGMSQEDIRSRLYNVCAIQPALKYQDYSGSDGVRYSSPPYTTSAKSKMAVGWGLNRYNTRFQDQRNPSMFYIMAQSIGVAPPSRTKW